jgi:hypothetical protein
MRVLGNLRRAPIAALLLIGGLLLAAGVVLADGGSGPISVCVPSKEGKPILTPKGGACKAGYALTEVGKEGPAGAQGEPGPAGSSVIARVRLAEPVLSTKEPSTVALTGATWTQAGEEIEQIAGQVTLTPPNRSECNAGESAPARGGVRIYLNGSQVSEASMFNLSLAPTTIQLDWGSPAGPLDVLFEPGTATTQTITAQAWDNCQAGGAANHGHFLIDAISLDVIGAH